MKKHAPRPAGQLSQPPFLPMTRQEMDSLGWRELDVLLVSGDAYVDHPSFGAALLGRWLVAHGYRVGVVAQPRWEDVKGGEGGHADVARMGRPRLFAGVTAGALDSMLAHYTAFRKKRSEDAYTPGGRAGARPNRACIVYAGLVRRAFPGLPVVLGGIEASLRRAAHYDFWSDSLRRSVLLDAKATAILYGMAEHSVLALAEGLHALSATEDLSDPAALRRRLPPLLARIPGAVFAVSQAEPPTLPPALPSGDAGRIELPSYEDILAEPKKLVEATLLLERQVHQDRDFAVQESGGRLVVMTPPGRGLEGAALDGLYALPFARAAHPSYAEPVPAVEMMRGSLTAHRGCAGGCSFCTLALHQGRRIRSRSPESVLAEARTVAGARGFSGSISDVGGPSANMWNARCAADPARCKRASCLTPAVCKHFKADQAGFVQLLRDVLAVPGVRHVRVASGWRMDLALLDRAACGAMVREFVGGQAKVAPEHMASNVLALMRKPDFAVFEEFLRLFARESANAGKEQYVIPYLMSAFPGCTDQDMRRLAAWLGERGWKPGQTQCFIPLPGTAAAAMFFAGVDLDGNPLPVARSDAERLRQHGVLAQPRERGQGERAESGPGARGGQPRKSGRPGVTEAKLSDAEGKARSSRFGRKRRK